MNAQMEAARTSYAIHNPTMTGRLEPKKVDNDDIMLPSEALRPPVFHAAFRRGSALDATIDGAHSALSLTGRPRHGYLFTEPRRAPVGRPFVPVEHPKPFIATSSATDSQLQVGSKRPHALMSSTEVWSVSG